VLTVGPADEASDEPAGFPAVDPMQDVLVPPPLIDPDVDIANDPAYAIRLMDILDQITSSSSSGVSSKSASQDSLVQVRVLGLASMSESEHASNDPSRAVKARSARSRVSPRSCVIV